MLKLAKLRQRPRSGAGGGKATGVATQKAAMMSVDGALDSKPAVAAVQQAAAAAAVAATVGVLTSQAGDAESG